MSENRTVPPPPTPTQGQEPMSDYLYAKPKDAETSTVRREIDAITRQLDGLKNRLKRVKDSL